MGDILFLAHRVPWPPNRGDKIRSYNLLKKLMEAAPVHLACLADDQSEASEGDSIKEHLASCEIVVRDKPQWKAGIEALVSGKAVSLSSFESAALADSVRQTIRNKQIDCIFVFSGQMAQYVPVDLNGRFIMDFADVDSAKFETYGAAGSGPMAWINKREGKLLKTFEEQIAKRADTSLFVSEKEAEFFRKRTGLGLDKVSAVGNGIDLEFYNPAKAASIQKPASGPLIIFTGQMDYRPNVEAVQSFANDVMPVILAEHSDACFAIVGRAPTDTVEALHGRNGVIVTGAVADIRQWLKAADIVVAPLRIARGIQNKVLEAMAMGKPVVASTSAAEGIAAEHGKHFLIAKSTTEEAQQVSQLIKDKPSADQLGESAEQLIHSFYSWDNQLSNLHEICGLETLQVMEAAE
ncbi:MAG: TIGR03087 family PEP-CTERM/XrtA system glycosyltransferase [Parasphingorhabdus sp.]|uniref:TIGR03087 family PEP-CTERM/XrtA system glycosyltransferase n=1 Tax=Parasphingorhabdus sp. TaxID=2709688 RepID=UPI003299D286